MVTRILTAMLAVGGAEGGALAAPSCIVGCGCEHWLYEVNATSHAHSELALELATAGATLLKNDGVLPLAAGQTVALLGSVCDATTDVAAMEADYTLGDYFVVGGSGRVASSSPISLRLALEARGVRLLLSLTEDVTAAQAAMAQADIAIACAGGHSAETKDRPSLELDQHAFLAALAASSRSTRAGEGHAPLVIVTFSPGAIVAPWAESASGFLNMFLSGAQSGNAAADLLLGRSNPSGRLPVTYYTDSSRTIEPCLTPTCPLTERLHVGWRAFVQDNATVAFPFGHGLSYTRFEYSWAAAPLLDTSTPPVAAARGTVTPATRITMSLSIRNTGEVAGTEVVQCYLAFPAAAGEPPLVLRTFNRTALLQPSAEARVSLRLTDEDLSTWQPGAGWVRARGVFVVVIGASSRDVRLRHEVHVP